MVDTEYTKKKGVIITNIHTYGKRVILMNSRQKVMDIFNRKSNGEGAMWTGHPNANTVPVFAKEWGIEPTQEAIFDYLNDDCRRINADSAYQHPEAKQC